MPSVHLLLGFFWSFGCQRETKKPTGLCSSSLEGEFPRQRENECEPGEQNSWGVLRKWMISSQDHPPNARALTCLDLVVSTLQDMWQDRGLVFSFQAPGWLPCAVFTLIEIMWWEFLCLSALSFQVSVLVYTHRSKRKGTRTAEETLFLVTVFAPKPKTHPRKASSSVVATEVSSGRLWSTCSKLSSWAAGGFPCGGVRRTTWLGLMLSQWFVWVCLGGVCCAVLGGFGNYIR